MKPVERGEILPIAEYELIRPHFRARVLAEKRPRRVSLGDFLCATFENHDSVLFQIQEMVRTERITSETGIAHEIETYNDLIPGTDELSFTLFVEIPDRDTRERMLTELAGLEQAVFVEVAGARFAATQRLPDAYMPTRTTAVHYFKAKLSAAAAQALRERRAQAALIVDHPRCALRVELDAATLGALAADLGAA
jgi:hypothetical protein